MFCLYLIKITLLFVLGIILITEPVKKSLVPLGWLIFAIATNLLVDETGFSNPSSHSSIVNYFSDFVDISITKKVLYIGVNITTITWLLFIIFWEARIRLIILSRRKKKPDDRASSKQ